MRGRLWVRFGVGWGWGVAFFVSGCVEGGFGGGVFYGR